MAKASDLPGITGKGVAPISIPEVDDCVDEYVGKRDKRMDMTRKEVEAKGKLIGALRANAEKIGTDKDGTIIYRHEDLIVTLKHGKDDLKVRTEDSENGED
jgi:hypothetical protein